MLPQMHETRRSSVSSPLSPAFRPARGALVAAALIVLILLLAGCGQQGGVTHGPTPAPTRPTGGHPITGTSIRPCVGPVVSATSVGTVAHVLTGEQAGTTVSAKQGELVQVQLPANFHWTFDNQAGNLVVVQPADGQDPTLDACFWTFKAQSAGTVTLHFTGAPLCDPPVQVCSQLLLMKTYTIAVA